MSAPGSPAHGSTEVANIHLHVLGQERTVSVEFPLGEQPVGALLPVARQLTEQVTALAVDAAQRQGRSVSCRAGCGACCRQLVVISLVEAQELAELVAALPSERQTTVRGRFAAAVRRLEAAGLLDPAAAHGDRVLLCADAGDASPVPQSLGRRYFQLHIACPFLEEESCGIYSERPLVCREYHVTSPAADCARLYEVAVERVEVPHVGGALVRAAHLAAGVPLQAIPLVLALEWSEGHAGALGQATDGLGMVQSLMGALDRECAKPFDDRATTD